MTGASIPTLEPRPQRPNFEWSNLLAASPWVKPTSAPQSITSAVVPAEDRELAIEPVRVFWEPDAPGTPFEVIEAGDVVQENSAGEGIAIATLPSAADLPWPQVDDAVPADAEPIGTVADVTVEPALARTLASMKPADAEIESEIDEQIDSMRKVPIEDCLLGIFRLARTGIEGVLRAGSRSAPLLADGTTKISGAIATELKRFKDRIGSPSR